MTTPRPTDLQAARRAVRRLRRLPKFASMAGTHRDTAPTAPGATRPAPGPRLPAGVADVLDVLDAGREFPALLARLGQCTRTVLEELAGQVPPPAKGKPTWATECAYLASTAPAWVRSPWCVEWLDTETAELERILSDKVHAATGACAFCGVNLETRRIGPVVSAICPDCDRVANIRLTMSPEKAEQWRQARITEGTKRLAQRLGARPDVMLNDETTPPKGDTPRNLPRDA